MRILTDQIKMTNAPWPEHLVMSSKEIIDVDPSDGEHCTSHVYSPADGVQTSNERWLCTLWSISLCIHTVLIR
jgi:hypothetical protein